MVNRTFRVVVSFNAKARLKTIYRYYKENVSVELAGKIKMGILEEAKKLRRNPESKPLLRMKKTVVPPYRYTTKWSYKIIFQVFENEDLVSIVDFIHDKEDPQKKESI